MNKPFFLIGFRPMSYFTHHNMTNPILQSGGLELLCSSGLHNSKDIVLAKREYITLSHSSETELAYG